MNLPLELRRQRRQSLWRDEEQFQEERPSKKELEQQAKDKKAAATKAAAGDLLPGPPLADIQLTETKLEIELDELLTGANQGDAAIGTHW